MKKVELIEAVAAKAGLTKADAGRALDATIEAITGALVKGDRVPLVGFGTFATSKRAAIFFSVSKPANIENESKSSIGRIIS